MINARLSENTNSLKMDGKVFCAYCGQVIEPDVEIDHYDRTEYFHCNCPDALKEIEILKAQHRNFDKLKRKANEFDKLKRKANELREELENLRASAKYKVVTVSRIEKCE